MNPADEWRAILLSAETLLSAKNSGKKSFSPHIIPQTKGLESSLPY